MRFLNIQRFAGWEEIKESYNADISAAQAQLSGLDEEKQKLLDDYTLNYNNQLAKYEELQNQQQANIDTWKETQEKTQQAQTDYNIGLINQNKEQAQKQTDAELGDAYIDYQKGMNQFGGNAEALASSGLAGTGFSKNAEIAMNITYQNRVSTANAALTKANTEYSNQIQQALLNNDAALAEIALQHLQQSYQIALQGFEYKTNLENNKLAYEMDISDTYFNRQQTLQDNINYYNERLSKINEYQEQQAQWEREFEQQKKEHEDSMTQFWASLGEEQRQFDVSTGITYDDNGNVQYNNTTQESDVDYHSRVYGNNSNTFNKKDYYFDNGYQPRYINNVKVNKTGVKASEIFSAEDLKALGISGSQNIWNAGGTYYVWLGQSVGYKKVDKDTVKKEATWWDSLWHKGI